MSLLRYSRFRLWILWSAGMILLAALTACDGAIIDAPSPVSGNETEFAEVTSTGAGVAFNSERNAYFGDLHVHTGLSFDAYLGNVRTLPEDAYRFARGETITHANGMPVRLLGPPLDFVAVTDHAEYLGAMREANDPARRLSKDPLAAGLFSENPAEANAAFFRVLARYRANDMPEGFKAPDVIGRAWGIVQDAAEKYNEPGRFTTFVGYEFTSEPGGLNLHRNVLFRSATVPEFPFAALESEDPEDLWKKMEQWREEGADALAIPHNSNGSDGIMFELVRRNDEPMDADYAALRMRNEPLVEITQVKGTSDTHPILSPNDEWSDFELMEKRVGSNGDVTNFRGSYVRQALKDGLLLQETEGFNPFRFGFVGSSDTHNSAPGSVEEANYFSKAGVVDGTAELRSSVPPDRATTWPDGTPNSREASKPYQSWSSAGLVGVWAESNTRDMIFDALRRKETFATSGPRIKVRFFAGYDLAGEGGVIPESIAQMDAQAVPMGGDLSYQEGKAPEFFVWGLRDPSSAFLQRAQIVKGWVEDGQSREQVFDVACADGGTVDPETFRCPDNFAMVDLATCTPTPFKGDVALRTLWQDPTFDPDQRAFYYVRILENPTCRWSTWDAIRNGTPPNPTLHPVIQERAWSSPIWFEPGPT